MDIASTYLAVARDLDVELSAPIEAAMVALEDDTLLAALAARPSISQATRVALSRSRAFQVKAAYLVRPELSGEDLALALTKEKRVTVLAAVAANPSASPELLASLSTDPKPTLATALLKNPSTPVDALVSSALVLAKTQRCHADDLALAQVLEPPHAASSAVASALVFEPGVDRNVLAWLLPLPLSSEQLEHLAKLLILDPYANLTQLQGFERRGVQHQARQRAMTLLGNPVLDPSLGCAVAEAVLGDTTATLDATTKALLLVFTASGADRDQAAELMRSRQRLRNDACVTSDPGRLDELVEAALQEAERTERRSNAYVHPSSLPRLVDVLATNVNLTSTQVLKLLPHLSQRQVVKLADSVVPAVRVGTALEADDRSLLATGGLAANDLNAVLTRDPDPHAFCKAAVAVAEQHVGWSRAQSFSAILACAAADDAVVRLIPVDQVELIAPPVLVRVLTSALGDDPSTWDSFRALALDFTGGLGDLLDSVQALSD